MKRCVSLLLIFGLSALLVAGTAAQGRFADEKEGKGDKGVKEGEKVNKGDKGNKGGKQKDKGGPGAEKGAPGEKAGPPKFQLGNVLPPMMKDELKLTKEQAAIVERIEKDVRDKLNKILTDDQKQTIENFRPRPPMGGPGGPGGPGGDRPGGPGGPGGDRPGEKKRPGDKE